MTDIINNTELPKIDHKVSRDYRDTPGGNYTLRAHGLLTFDKCRQIHRRRPYGSRRKKLCDSTYLYSMACASKANQNSAPVSYYRVSYYGEPIIDIHTTHWVLYRQRNNYYLTNGYKNRILSYTGSRIYRSENSGTICVGADHNKFVRDTYTIDYSHNNKYTQYYSYRMVRNSNTNINGRMEHRRGWWTVEGGYGRMYSIFGTHTNRARFLKEVIRNYAIDYLKSYTQSLGYGLSFCSFCSDEEVPFSHRNARYEDSDTGVTQGHLVDKLDAGWRGPDGDFLTGDLYSSDALLRTKDKHILRYGILLQAILALRGNAFFPYDADHGVIDPSVPTDHLSEFDFSDWYSRNRYSAVESLMDPYVKCTYTLRYGLIKSYLMHMLLLSSGGPAKAVLRGGSGRNDNTRASSNLFGATGTYVDLDAKTYRNHRWYDYNSIVNNAVDQTSGIDSIRFDFWMNPCPRLLFFLMLDSYCESRLLPKSYIVNAIRKEWAELSRVRNQKHVEEVLLLSLEIIESFLLSKCPGFFSHILRDSMQEIGYIYYAIDHVTWHNSSQAGVYELTPPTGLSE